MIVDNGTLEPLVGELVEETENTVDSISMPSRTCEICGVDEWAEYTDAADVEVVRYSGYSLDDCLHTIDRVELTVDIVNEVTKDKKWKESCGDCGEERKLGDIDIQDREVLTEYKIGVKQIRKNLFHEHHTSYIPEETISVCPSCHAKIHNRDGFHDDLKPDIRKAEFRQIRENE